MKIDKKEKTPLKWITEVTGWLLLFILFGFAFQTGNRIAQHIIPEPDRKIIPVIVYEQAELQVLLENLEGDNPRNI